MQAKKQDKHPLKQKNIDVSIQSYQKRRAEFQAFLNDEELSKKVIRYGIASIVTFLDLIGLSVAAFYGARAIDMARDAGRITQSALVVIALIVLWLVAFALPLVNLFPSLLNALRQLRLRQKWIGIIALVIVIVGTIGYYAFAISTLSK